MYIFRQKTKKAPCGVLVSCLLNSSNFTPFLRAFFVHLFVDLQVIYGFFVV